MSWRESHLCPRVVSSTLTHAAELRLEWMDALPRASSLCLHLCLKGRSCRSAGVVAALRGLRKLRVHSCVEEPGGHEYGHEGVCAFRFLMDNYDASHAWTGVYFLHADMPAGKHAVQLSVLKRFLSAGEWPPWPESYGELQERHCGCRLLDGPFGPRDFWYTAISWYLSHFVVPRDPSAAASLANWMQHVVGRREEAGAYPLHNGSLKSPEGAMFAVDRATVLRRSRRFYEANYHMAKYGVRVLPPGQTGQKRASSQAAFDYNPLVWGHVNERLAPWQFGRDFVEAPDIPSCIWCTDHAIMNCTQLVFTRMNSRVAEETRKAYFAHWSTYARQHDGQGLAKGFKNYVRDRQGVPRCLPFEACGNVGLGG
ncbi:hypothetical protein AB1Y20_015054 [Prymnesium parvum]|uniref:Protein xylosyltransferase n=1 Tax=Prymnesium parvum TaxID=97485 RepID=A0AB34JXC8_PRYPA